VAGKRVLDIACGEGYGTAALLRAGAASVIGVDVSAETCAHAARRYGIEARVGDAQKIPLPDASVDVVVSFETIEHVPRPDLFLDECARVLAPGGRLIVSTPNRETYHEYAPDNPFHVREMSEAEFRAALGTRFGEIRMFTQRPKTAAWWALRSLAADWSFWQTARGLGIGWLLRRARKIFCSEVVQPQALERSRGNPVETILARPGALAHLANPFAIRPQRAATGEAPIYLVAVASPIRAAKKI
jgi:SAM-dependent methyltransferase